MQKQSFKIKYTLLQQRDSSESEKMTDLNTEVEKNDNLNLVEIAKDNTSTMKHRKEKSKVFSENVTTAIHIILFQFVIYILYLSFSHEVELFTWHPILLSIGWALLMTEAILALSPENCFTKSILQKNRIFFHWVIQAIAAICILAGFIIVIINKNLKNKHHFVTWHAIFGLVSIIFLVPTCLNGILTLFKVELRNYLHPVLNKVIHVVSGTLTFTFGAVTLILSLYSNWFTKKTGYTAQVVCFIAIVFISLWVVLKPIKYLIKKVIFRSI